MGIIFVFSQQPGSGASWEPPLWYVLERKSAHVIEYAILLLLAAISLRYWFPRESEQRVLWLALILTSTYGVLDEIHQAFIFGRGSRLTDVFIDIGGALVGLLSYKIFQQWRKQSDRSRIV